jgi:hypothetical protein
MARTAKRKPDKTARDAEEYKRFLDAAKAAEAEETPEAFERAFKRVVSAKRHPPKP